MNLIVISVAGCAFVKILSYLSLAFVSSALSGWDVFTAFALYLVFVSFSIVNLLIIMIIIIIIVIIHSYGQFK